MEVQLLQGEGKTTELKGQTRQDNAKRDGDKEVEGMIKRYENSLKQKARQTEKDAGAEKRKEMGFVKHIKP